MAATGTPAPLSVRPTMKDESQCSLLPQQPIQVVPVRCRCELRLLQHREGKSSLRCCYWRTYAQEERKRAACAPRGPDVRRRTQVEDVVEACVRGTGLVGCARVPGEERSEGDADRVARASIAPQHTCSVAMLLDPCAYWRPFLTCLPSRSN
eukprot:scaffold18446_cov69-Phaeocystis_antarctica.AAC.2